LIDTGFIPFHGDRNEAVLFLNGPFYPAIVSLSSFLGFVFSFLAVLVSALRQSIRPSAAMPHLDWPSENGAADLKPEKHPACPFGFSEPWTGFVFEYRKNTDTGEHQEKY